MPTIKEATKVAATPQTVVPSNKATMVKNLIKQYKQLGEEETKIQESRAAVREMLVNMFEEGAGELVVGKKAYATLAKENRTLLNTALIKKSFPQEKFSDFYVDSQVTVLRLTKEARSLS